MDETLERAVVAKVTRLSSQSTPDSICQLGVAAVQDGCDQVD